MTTVLSLGAARSATGLAAMIALTAACQKVEPIAASATPTASTAATRAIPALSSAALLSAASAAPALPAVATGLGAPAILAPSSAPDRSGSLRLPARWIRERPELDALFPPSLPYRFSEGWSWRDDHLEHEYIAAFERPAPADDVAAARAVADRLGLSIGVDARGVLRHYGADLFLLIEDLRLGNFQIIIKTRPSGAPADVGALVRAIPLLAPWVAPLEGLAVIGVEYGREEDAPPSVRIELRRDKRLDTQLLPLLPSLGLRRNGATSFSGEGPPKQGVLLTEEDVTVYVGKR